MIIWHKTCTVNGKKKPWQLVICSLFMHVTKSDLFGALAKEVNRNIPTDLGFLFVCTVIENFITFVWACTPNCKLNLYEV